MWSVLKAAGVALPPDLLARPVRRSSTATGDTFRERERGPSTGKGEGENAVWGTTPSLHIRLLLLLRIDSRAEFPFRLTRRN